MPEATHAPECTSGPSGPTIRPDETERIRRARPSAARTAQPKAAAEDPARGALRLCVREYSERVLPPEQAAIPCASRMPRRMASFARLSVERSAQALPTARRRTRHIRHNTKALARHEDRTGPDCTAQHCSYTTSVADAVLPTRRSARPVRTAVGSRWYTFECMHCTAGRRSVPMTLQTSVRIRKRSGMWFPAVAYSTLEYPGVPWSTLEYPCADPEEVGHVVPCGRLRSL